MVIMNKINRSIVVFLLVSVIFFGQPEFVNVVGYSASAATTLASPKASLKSGTYTTASYKTVKLTCSTKKAKIYYSLNGAKYRLYSQPIRITKNSTLKFYSELNGTKSKTVIRKYDLMPDIEVVKTGRSPIRVELNTTDKGVTIYYTTDGKKPTKNSEKYASVITVTHSCTLRAMVVKSGWTTKYISEKIVLDTPEYSASYLNNIKSKYYYTHLSGNSKRAYERIFNAIKNFEPSVDLTDLQICYDDAYHISQIVGFENPQLFWLDGRSCNADGYLREDEFIVTNFYIDYLRTSEEAAEIAPRLEKKAQEIVTKAQKEGSEFLCVKYLHDYIKDNTYYNDYASEYSNGALGNHADEVLLEGKGVCAGYSRALDYLLQTAGILSFGIVGDTPWGQHMWNKVKLGDSWYNIDSTWDDTNDSYSYFCLTDSEFGKDHFPRSQLPLSAATAYSTKYSYYNGMGLTIYSTVNQAVKESMKTLAEGYKVGQREFTFYYKKGLSNKVIERLSDDFYTLVNSYGVYPTFENWAFYDDRFFIKVS